MRAGGCWHPNDVGVGIETGTDRNASCHTVQAAENGSVKQDFGDNGFYYIVVNLYWFIVQLAAL